jgi:hypothetical protein
MSANPFDVPTGQPLSSTFRSRVKEDKPVSIKLDNIKVLTGQDNYNIWAATMTLVWKGMKCYEIVVEGLDPAADAAQDEIDAYTALCHQAAAVYIQVVSTDILEKIVELDHPHKMWKYLRTEFYRDTAFALVSQITTLTSLSTTYDPSQPISTFISQFETEWLRLTKLAKASKDSYRQAFAKFLDEDKAKRDFLLGFIVRHQKNVVDNLSTKDDLTFAEVKQRLHDIDVDTTSSSDTALSAITKGTGRGRDQTYNNNRSSTSSSSKPKECTWCKKHYPGRALGHYWNDCFKLKEQNEQKRKDKGKDKKEKQDESHVTTDMNDNEVRYQPFIFDTAASSHMCPNPDRFEHLSVCSGSVKSSSTESMSVKGKGTVVMDCVLKDGSVSSFRIHDVLFVPQLDRPLVSWRVLAKKGYRMMGSGDEIVIVKDGKTWFEAIFDGGTVPHIPEVRDSAYMTFEFWHEALGHLAPSSIERYKTQLDAAKIIPPCPDGFHCEACTLAKSTHSTPKPVTTRAAEKGDLIHTCHGPG